MNRLKKTAFMIALLAVIIFVAFIPGEMGDKGYINTGRKGHLRFVVMADSRGTDNGINSNAIKKTLKEIKKLSPQPSFAVMPGDLVVGAKSYADTKAQLEYFKDTITKYYPIDFFFPGFGNHEAAAGAEGEAAFGEVFHEFKAKFMKGYNNTVYYFDNSGYRFYMLNSNHPGESSLIPDAQLNWIRDNTDPGRKRSFYFFHEPAYPTGNHVGGSLDENSLQRDRFWEVIDSSKGPMAFCGHEHFYTRRHIDSAFDETVSGQDFRFNKLVYQVTVGTFGAPAYDEYNDKRNVDVPPIPAYHYAVVDATAGSVEVTVYNLNGRIIDRFVQ
jgi:hypothetical protein